MEDSPVIHKGTSAVPDWALRLPSPHVQHGDIFLDSALGILQFLADDCSVSRPQTSGAPLAEIGRLPAPDDFGFYHAPPTARSVASSQSLRSLNDAASHKSAASGAARAKGAKNNRPRVLRRAATATTRTRSFG